ncbi:MAG TPA: hypothetical protein VGE31_00495 [Candidatus Paceibacterota bacterium]
MSFKTFTAEEDHPLALKPSLMAMLRGSEGSNAFRRLYRVLPGNVSDDVIYDGDLACAYTVSSWLYLFGLIRGGVHTTVAKTIEDLTESGWEESALPAAGCVVLWGVKQGDDGRPHYHIGICLSASDAVSNYAPQKQPKIHPIHGFLKNEKGEEREVITFFKHPLLEE